MTVNFVRRSRFLARPIARVFVLAVAFASIQIAYGGDDSVEGKKVCAFYDLEMEYVLSATTLDQDLPANLYVEGSTLRQDARRACNAGHYDEGVEHFRAAATTLGLHLNIAKHRVD